MQGWPHARNWAKFLAGTHFFDLCMTSWGKHEAHPYFTDEASETQESTETQLQVEKWRFKLEVPTHIPKSNLDTLAPLLKQHHWTVAQWPQRGIAAVEGGFKDYFYNQESICS